MNKELNDLYIIEMECIDEGNAFGLKLGDIVYRYPIGTAPGTEKFTTDSNHAWMTDDFNAVKREATRIYRNGNFMPTIKVVYRNIGSEIYVDYDKNESPKTFWDYIDTLKDGSDEWRIAMDLGSKYHNEGKNPDNYIDEIINKVNKK